MQRKIISATDESSAGSSLFTGRHTEAENGERILFVNNKNPFSVLCFSV